jgi:hypothetical protein
VFVNPGSPNLPAEPRPGGLGTVAVVDLGGGVARAMIRDV